MTKISQKTFFTVSKTLVHMKTYTSIWIVTMFGFVHYPNKLIWLFEQKWFQIFTFDGVKHFLQETFSLISFCQKNTNTKWKYKESIK